MAAWDAFAEVTTGTEPQGCRDGRADEPDTE